MTFDAVDDFAGPGGWDEGARMIGLRFIGNEWDHAACLTAKAAGHERIRTDVARSPSHPFLGIPGHVSSPPCTLFSAAGSGVGNLVIDVLGWGIREIFAGRDARDEVRSTILTVTRDQAEAKNEKRTDEKKWTPVQVEEKAVRDAFTASLVLEPARRIMDLDPAWVALEQVPEVLPLWQIYVRELRARGYSAWTVVLNSADYGVPQTRRRAALGASRVRRTAPPEPTHAEHPQDVDLFGGGRLPWVSMHDGLGWGDTQRPYYTLTSDPTGGGSGARNLIKQAAGNPSRWTRERPATTVVGSFRPDIIAAPGYRTDISRQDAPGSVQITVQEAGILQSFPPDYPWRGNKGKQYEQAGNAVPPLLAAHILSAITGRPLP